jgi:hypothetical protein
MSGFLAELGSKIADRWVNLLVLPGLLWTAALAAGLRLGQDHPVDVARLRVWLDQVAGQPASHDIATVALAAAAILLASAAVALAASAVGALLQRLWVMPGDLPPAAWLRRRRQHRWQQATAQLKTAIARAAHPDAHHADPAEAARRARRALRRQARIGPAQPMRPTRIGDRFHATALRIRDHNGLDLDLVWPRLWTVLPDPLRTDLTTAQDAYTAAARLAAWGIFYLALTAAWWPATLISLVIFSTAAIRAQASADVLADLIETAADLHAKDLATALDLPLAGVTNPAELGRSITQRLQAAPELSHRPSTGTLAPLPGAAPPSSSTQPLPLPQSANGTWLTRAGTRPLCGPHEIPTRGFLPYLCIQAQNRGKCAGMGVQVPSDTNPLRMFRPGLTVASTSWRSGR